MKVGQGMTQEDDKKGELTVAPIASRAERMHLLRQMGEESGSFEMLGAHHFAVFNDDSPTLLVTFDTLDAVLACAPGQMPACFSLATQNGWSHLSLICNGDTWYRDPAVYAYFDRLVDDAFFEDFDRVVFYGAGMGAYAACTFSVAAPGATVLAVQPRATLDPSIAGWDQRYRQHRRLNFSDRYGYAPDMVDGAAKVFVILDPTQAEDAMHAALFRAPHVQPLRCRFMGGDINLALEEMNLLKPLLNAAVEDGLHPALFYRLWRARRNNIRFLRLMLTAAIKARKPAREAGICRSVNRRMRAPGFRRHLAELEARGAVLPHPDSPPPNAPARRRQIT